MMYVVKDLETLSVFVTAHKIEAFRLMGELTEQRHEYYAIAAEPDNHGVIEVFGDTIEIH